MNTTLQRLLPPQATALERAVLEVAPAWDDLADVGVGIDHTRPDPFKPWLAAEWELAQFSQYFPDLDALLAAGLPWLLERGTAAAVRRVLDWLGYGAAVIEEDGAYLQIDLGRVASPERINHIARLVRSSIPVHIRFYRVFHGWDLRPLRLDAGRLDEALLDDDSGVWVVTDTGTVKVSFGSTSGGRHPAPGLAAGIWSGTANRTGRLTYDDRMLLDTWRLDSEVLVDAYGGLGAVFSGLSAAPPLGGGAEPTRGETRSGAPAWSAPDASGARTDTFSKTAPVPVDPPRPWGGAWGGAWRQTISYRSTTET